MIPRTIYELRRKLDKAFRQDTSYRPAEYKGGSCGHCYLVSLLVQLYFGGRVVSTVVDGVSHRFNRLNVAGVDIDVDLTGDQFGNPKVMVGLKGELYTNSRVMPDNPLGKNTQERLGLLIERAGLNA